MSLGNFKKKVIEASEGAKKKMKKFSFPLIQYFTYI